MTTVVISQPMYFAWPGFFEQMALADVYVWLDDVQFSKGSYTNRIQVKLPGGIKWMTVPLRGRGTNTAILALEPADDDWYRSHRAILEQSFRSTPYCDLSLNIFDTAVQVPRLCDLLIASSEEPARRLGCLPKTILRSSALNISGKSSARVLDIVRALGARRYVTGHGAACYLDHRAFEAAGIDVEYMDYGPVPWAQGHGEFTPFVTVLDLIAARGPHAAEHLSARTKHWRNFLRDTGRPCPPGDL